MIAALLALVAAHLPAAIGALVLGGGGLGALVARVGLGGVGRWFGQHRGFLVLIAVAIAAAFLWARYAQVQSERDRARQWRLLACSTVGVDPRGPAYKRGDCVRRMQQLVRLERDTLQATNKALAGALEEHRRKTAHDLDTLTRSAREMSVAAAAMEKANASVGPDDRVDGDWFHALNRTGGLWSPAR